MFLNSSIGISEGVRATLFLRDCRKRNIIHRGGVDIKWNGPVYAFDSSFNTESIKPNQLKNDSGRFLPPKNSDHNEVYFSLILQPTSYVFTVRFGSLRYLSFSDFAEMCDRLTMTKKGCHE